ncbi:MAG: DNA adenine methylase [bacterium]|nr:DNA adenine methylase [bacterium]
MGALIPYFGGKSRLAKQVVARMPEHSCYVEVFAGAAAVFFSKEPSKTEVINDLDRELITLYRAVQNHPEELRRQFKYTLVARDEFNRLMRAAPDTLTDIQRAARYLYLQRTCYGGRVHQRTFGTVTVGKPRLNLFTLEETLETAWRRLAQALIECMDFRDLIARYDRPHTLFYLDPPYWDIVGYEHNFVEQDFVDLAQALAGIKGRFLMSINDTPEVREVFGRFQIEEVTLKYSMGKGQGSRDKLRTELLISN